MAINAYGCNPTSKIRDKLANNDCSAVFDRKSLKVLLKAADENNHDAKRLCEQFKQCIILIDDSTVITDKAISNIIQLSQDLPALEEKHNSDNNIADQEALSA